MVFGFNTIDLKMTFNFFKMNVRDKYLGSSLGRFWAIANPVFMLSVYTYVFGFVFKVKLPGAETTLSYVIWLISGYGPWMAFQESVVNASSSIVGASGIVKNMAFKTELLPFAATLVGLINLVISLIFLFILLIWSGATLTSYLLMLPLIVFVQFLFAVSIGIWVSMLAVFVRDVIQIIPTLLMVYMFMTPIFYSFDSMPKIVQVVSSFNPLYQISEAYRAVIISGKSPDILGLLYVMLLSMIVMYFGLKSFRRVKGDFDSVL